MKYASSLRYALLALALTTSLSANATDEYHHGRGIGPVWNVNAQQATAKAYGYANAEQAQFQGQQANQANQQVLNVQGTNFPRQTAMAYAAPVIIPECANGGSAGVQRPTFGLSFGFAKQDGHCEMLADAEFLKSLGMVDTAKSRLCQDAKIAKAMRDSGEWECVE